MEEKWWRRKDDGERIGWWRKDDGRTQNDGERMTVEGGIEDERMEDRWTEEMMESYRYKFPSLHTHCCGLTPTWAPQTFPKRDLWSLRCLKCYVTW